MTLAFAPLDRELTLTTSALTVGVDTELPCRQYDPDLWFADVPADLEVAKALCGSCPLKAECLAGAIERAEPWGVWGGEIFERGAVVPRKRPRGRPRKEDLARDAVLRVEVANRTNAVIASVMTADRKVA
jgi:WhiB family transcriptional regulator, redox-sensing transcriptional regulator